MSEAAEKKPRILIVDDESAIRELLAEMLADEYECIKSESAEAALAEFEREVFDLVISDVNLGGMTGVEMVPRIQSISPDTVVMVISGASSVDIAIDAMRAGVFDYLRKPFDYDQVIAAVRRALEHRRSLVEKRLHANELATLVEQRTAEVRQLSQYDKSTGLPNESTFESRLEQMLDAYDSNQQTAVLLLSVPTLRAVRDGIGQAAANRILVEIARRLQSLDRDMWVARFEGDKFGSLVSNTDSSSIVELVKRVFNTLKAAFAVDDNQIHVQINIGISLFSPDTSDHHSLIRNARVALSQAESEGAGTYRFYSSEMNTKVVQQLALENNLRDALERNEFTVVYQPKLDFTSRRIVGMEALIRWNSRELGPVPPNLFIPVAEATDLINPIGEWVLRTACKQTRTWHDNGFPLQLASNLSPRQFRDKDLADSIRNILDETGLDPNYLNLEVTETSIVTSPEAAVDLLARLQKLGISISIDDFGTGYSSLSYLRSLPIDVLKIDRSFVRNIAAEDDAVTLVKAMISLAHDLRLRVVAEGVETEEQFTVLSSLGCDEWQGFLHSKPMPADKFEERLRMEP